MRVFELTYPGHEPYGIMSLNSPYNIINHIKASFSEAALSLNLFEENFEEEQKNYIMELRHLSDVTPPVDRWRKEHEDREKRINEYLATKGVFGIEAAI